ncbi:chorismate mutase family protein [Rhodococcus spelaei]|uniref:Chorismate mutase family protein n=1 Tax=Rhodococcus spelaei TaxID=2546320 RepID=A0A541B7M4_9NOCA|nr:chorismate mutase family protein [Rhodococcus spelaei]TQF68326.1 chorismate mutase family protein [Rhodococcus spelaei]
MDDTNGRNGAGRTDRTIHREVSAPHAHDELESLREELDRIDGQLLDSVRDRIDVCARIAVVKRRSAIPMMQPRRVGAVHEHARSYAQRHDLSVDFLRNLYDLLIAETCRVEDAIIDAVEPPDELGVRVRAVGGD